VSQHPFPSPGWGIGAYYVPLQATFALLIVAALSTT